MRLPSTLMPRDISFKTAVLALSFMMCAVVFAVPASAQMLAGEREAKIQAIPGVISGDAKWELIWADFYTADGIAGVSADGSVMFAQEQTDKIFKLDNGGKQYMVTAADAPGAVSIDTKGNIYTVERGCTEPLNDELAGCDRLTRVSQVLPEYKVLADSFPDGRSLGRLNDLIADGKGGAYFTQRGLYYVTPGGVVQTVAEEGLFSNGVMLNKAGTRVYVTNNTEVLVFDVNKDGSTKNRRVFASLNGDNGGDGMAIDNEDRLYVTAAQGVHVIAADGTHLGVIPTKRRAITLAFSGPDKKYLYVPQMGAVGPDGKAWETPEGIRNTAMTIYRIPMEAQGFLGRPK